MNEYRRSIYIKTTWRYKALIGLVRERQCKTSLLGNWKTCKGVGKRWFISAIAHQPLVGKEKGTQEKDGRDIKPAVIPTSHVGQCGTFELRNRGKAQGKWRAEYGGQRSPTRGKMPWMSRTFMASKGLTPLSPTRTLREGWLRALKPALVVPVGTETGAFYVFPYILPSALSCTPIASGGGWQAGGGAVLVILIIVSSKVPTRPFQSIHMPSSTWGIHPNICSSLSRSTHRTVNYFRWKDPSQLFLTDKEAHSENNVPEGNTYKEQM